MMTKLEGQITDLKETNYCEPNYVQSTRELT